MNSTATHSATHLEFQVRRATRDDVSTLAHFRFAFRSRRRPATESEQVFVERATPWMRSRLGADSHWRVWLLEHDGTAIGNIWLQLVEKIPNPGDESESYGYISNFYVEAAHRNAGGGSMLLGAALDECRRSDVAAVFLWPSDESRPLYARNGFAVTDRMLLRDLSEKHEPSA